MISKCKSNIRKSISCLVFVCTTSWIACDASPVSLFDSVNSNFCSPLVNGYSSLGLLNSNISVSPVIAKSVFLNNNRYTFISSTVFDLGRPNSYALEYRIGNNSSELPSPNRQTPSPLTHPFTDPNLSVVTTSSTVELMLWSKSSNEIYIASYREQIDQLDLNPPTIQSITSETLVTSAHSNRQFHAWINASSDVYYLSIYNIGQNTIDNSLRIPLVSPPIDLNLSTYDNNYWIVAQYQNTAQLYKYNQDLPSIENTINFSTFNQYTSVDIISTDEHLFSIYQTSASNIKIEKRDINNLETILNETTVSMNETITHFHSTLYNNLVGLLVSTENDEPKIYQILTENLSQLSQTPLTELPENQIIQGVNITGHSSEDSKIGWIADLTLRNTDNSLGYSYITEGVCP